MRQLSASPDRRHFLKTVAGAGAAALLAPHLGAAQETAKGSRLYVTSGKQRHVEGPRPVLRAGQVAPEAETVVLDAAHSFQPMLGFGCAYTDASCFLLSTMAPEARSRFLEDTFSPRSMALNVGRISIGASDYSRDVYNYDDVAGDVRMGHFSIDHDRAYLLPMLREMRQISPELFLLSTPWSPPGWMKTYGSMLGGWMTNKYLGPYALYLSRFLEAYRRAGVPIQAITSQNEVETDQEGRMPATYWPPELEADFVRDHLGPLLRQKGEPTQIWLLDHNYNLWQRVRWQMQDAALRPFVSGVAWHGYLGTPDMMSRLHEAEPDLPFYWTEGGPSIKDPKYTEDWTRWGTTFTEATRNWCRCLITWNLMLDPKGEPNIGPFSCGGLVTLNTDGSLTYSGQYWALRHFSQHIRRGAVRVATHSDLSELQHVAFRNPDGAHTLVLTNTGEQRTLTVLVPQGSVAVDLPAQSIATVTGL